MTRPEDPGIDQEPDHNVTDGPTLGWAAADFTRDDYVGDDETDALEVVADGTQVDEDDGA
jgi:hypothetical protein